MVDVIFEPRFRQLFSKIKDKETKNKIITQIEKIKANSEVGKPMMYGRKGTRELYILPFRLSYEYIVLENKVYMLDLYHKKLQ